MIYIDTGAFIARYIKKDQYHNEAVLFWNKFKKQKQKIYTSNFVIDEMLTLIGRRTGYKFAAERARNIYSSEALEMLRPGAEDEIKAVELFEKYADLSVSYTDCVSFVLMKRHRIKQVFTFDKHFEIAGFRVFP